MGCDPDARCSLAGVEIPTAICRLAEGEAERLGMSVDRFIIEAVLARCIAASVSSDLSRFERLAEAAGDALWHPDGADRGPGELVLAALRRLDELDARV